MQFHYPIIKLMAYEGALQSKLKPSKDGLNTIIFEGNVAYKVHFFQDMEFDQSYLLRIANEYSVMKLAR